MRTMYNLEIFTKKCRQQQIFDSDLKGVWHYNHVTFTPIAKKFMLYCRLIYMLSILCVRLMIKVKVGIPESFKVGWYPPKKTGSSHLNQSNLAKPSESCQKINNKLLAIKKGNDECLLTFHSYEDFFGQVIRFATVLYPL